MTRLMEVLKIYLEEQLLMEYCIIKHLILLKIQNMMGYQHGLASMVYNFFDKKSFVSDLKGEIMLNQELAEELHKPIIRKFKKQKVYIYFKVNIWGTDLAYMQLISKFNKGFRFLLCY